MKTPLNVYRGKSLNSGNWMVGQLLIAGKHAYITESNEKYTDIFQQTLRWPITSYAQTSKLGLVPVGPETVNAAIAQRPNGKYLFTDDIIRVTDEAETTEDHDRIFYYVAQWIPEWGMFCFLDFEEYAKYLTDGIEALDETMFWSFNAMDNRKKNGDWNVCGNVSDDWQKHFSCPECRSPKFKGELLCGHCQLLKEIKQ